ncbi:MAG: VanZ family protein [Flavobacteriaceae bacterium]
MQRLYFSEQYYWRCSALVALLIFATLFVGSPLQQWWTDQNSHAAVFLLSMLLIGTSVLMGGLSLRDRWEIWALRLGLGAVFIMFLLRLSASERSHIIEYCILTYCVYKAFETRYKTAQEPKWVGLMTGLCCIAVGLIDEGVQYGLPQRVGSWEDVMFDSGAVVLTLATLALLKNARKWLRK